MTPMGMSERIVAILPKELVDELTELAKSKGLARTAYIRMILTEHVQAQRAAPEPEDPSSDLKAMMKELLALPQAEQRAIAARAIQEMEAGEGDNHPA